MVRRIIKNKDGKIVEKEEVKIENIISPPTEKDSTKQEQIDFFGIQEQEEEWV